MEQTELIYNGEVADRLSHAIVDGGHGLDNVPGLLKKMLKENLWQERYVNGLKRNVSCKRFVEFVTKPPLEGLGSTVKTLRRLCADDPEALKELENAVTGSSGGDWTSESSIRTIDPYATAKPRNRKAEGLRRLEAERPELYEQVKDKQLTTNAALVQAGFRREPTTVEKMQKLWLKMTAEEKEAFQMWAIEQL